MQRFKAGKDLHATTSSHRIAENIAFLSVRKRTLYFCQRRQIKGQEDTLLLLLCVQWFFSNLLLLSCYWLLAGESM